MTNYLKWRRNFSTLINNISLEVATHTWSHSLVKSFQNDTKSCRSLNLILRVKRKQVSMERLQQARFNHPGASHVFMALADIRAAVYTETSGDFTNIT